MKLQNYDIKRIVRSGKGKVVFLTKELDECKMTDRVIVTVEEDKRGKSIRIRSFSLKR
ncbi:hypothetical protein HYZ41_04345 [archaeon]|nr:hypothetical protein [archaeon]